MHMTNENPNEIRLTYNGAIMDGGNDGHDQEMESLRRRQTSRRRIGWLAMGGLACVLAVGGTAMVVATPMQNDNVQVAENAAPQGTRAKAKAAKPAAAAPAQPAQQQSAQSATTAPASQSPFLAHAHQAGLTTCGAVYPALGEILTRGSEYMVQSTWNQTNPNAFPLQALVGMNYRTDSYTGPAVGAIFASPNGQQCEGDMVRVVPLQQTCEAAASQLPQGAQPLANLASIPVYNLPDGGGQVFLMSSGPTCVAVSVFRVAH